MATRFVTFFAVMTYFVTFFAVLTYFVTKVSSLASRFVEVGWYSTLCRYIMCPTPDKMQISIKLLQDQFVVILVPILM